MKEIIMNHVKGLKYLHLIVFLIIQLIVVCNPVSSAANTQKIKWECSAIVYIEKDIVIAEDKYGNIIQQGKSGKTDADVIQFAVDISGPAGEIKICKGKYILDKPILIYHNMKISGEGRGTILVPPIDDYVFKVEKGEREIFSRPYHVKEGFPLYAVIFRDMTIDGKREGLHHSGKGFYLRGFWSSVFNNLWIQNTGNALSINHVKESDFANIYLINNGDEEKKEPSVFITGGNNLHFSGLYVIYQNYIGLEVDRGKLIFISQSMFHGWLKREGETAKYPLIQVKDSNGDRKKEGRYKADFVLENSRITVGGEGTNAINVINSPVTVTQCVATCGFGNTVISATQNARVNASNNSFYSFKPLPMGSYVLFAEDSEVIFKNNVVSFQNLQVCLKAVRNSIIADNRFDAISEMPNINIGDYNNQGCRNVQVKGNIFRQEKLEDAVKVSKLSTKGIMIKDNQIWSE
jgi:hypothetical protein